jgi:uncharacterized protein involved in outer membrane biogenesis
MKKRNIIVFFIIFILSVFLIIDFLSYKLNKILKSLIIEQGKEVFGHDVTVGKIDTSILGSSIKISNIEIKNLEGFKNKNLIQIKDIYANFSPTSLLQKTIIVKNVSINGASLYYEVNINNKQVKDNIGSLKTDSKDSNNLKDQKDQIKESKINKQNKDFLINQLVINDAKINAYSEFLDINKEINLNKMTFNNIGTAEKTINFKEVLKMIFANVLLNINNEVIQGSLKEKMKSKVKTLKNKISPDSFKKLEKTFK